MHQNDPDTQLEKKREYKRLWMRQWRASHPITRFVEVGKEEREEGHCKRCGILLTALFAHGCVENQVCGVCFMELLYG